MGSVMKFTVDSSLPMACTWLLPTDIDAVDTIRSGFSGGLCNQRIVWAGVTSAFAHGADREEACAI